MEILLEKINELCIERGIEYDDYDQYKEELQAFVSDLGFEIQIMEQGG